MEYIYLFIVTHNPWGIPGNDMESKESGPLYCYSYNSSYLAMNTEIYAFGQSEMCLLANMNLFKHIINS